MMKKIKTRILFLELLLLALGTHFLPVNKDVSQVFAASQTAKISIIKGESFQIPNKKIENATSFLSTDKMVATISKKGVIRGKSAGSATISFQIDERTYTYKVTVRDTLDIIVFSGQSNMTNVGDKKKAPALTSGAGYEALLSSSKISPITEPFGVGQTKASKKSNGATLVTSFTNAYFAKSKTPILAVNTSVGGTSIGNWSMTYYKDIAKKVSSMEKLLKKKGLKKGHVYIVFLQGENDAMNGVQTSVYRRHLELFMKNLQGICDVENCLLIRIGNNQKDLSQYDKIAAIQTLICKEDKRFVLISTNDFSSSYYQEDGIHLNQKGLNAVGKQAGANAASYSLTQSEPQMKDKRYNNTYVSNCND